MGQDENLSQVKSLLLEHRRSFLEAKKFADITGHTVPSDTKSWSQILASLLTGKKGLFRQKGSDLEDGSDVKAANAWDAIDKPRFNGVLPAGRIGNDVTDVSSLIKMPYLFFVMWDWIDSKNKVERCRVWVVRTNKDKNFKKVANKWYKLRKDGEIKSSNFQLHPPIHQESDVVTNECGNIELPLLFRADWSIDKMDYVKQTYNPQAMEIGECLIVGAAKKRNRS